MHRPSWVIGSSVGLVAIAIGLTVLPSLWLERFAMLHPVQVDTDPENMLSEENPTRAFHRQAKVEFELYDQIAGGRSRFPSAGRVQSRYAFKHLGTYAVYTEYRGCHYA